MRGDVRVTSRWMAKIDQNTFALDRSNILYIHTSPTTCHLATSVSAAVSIEEGQAARIESLTRALSVRFQLQEQHHTEPSFYHLFRFLCGCGYWQFCGLETWHAKSERRKVKLACRTMATYEEAPHPCDAKPPCVLIITERYADSRW